MDFSCRNKCSIEHAQSNWQLLFFFCFCFSILLLFCFVVFSCSVVDTMWWIGRMFTRVTNKHTYIYLSICWWLDEEYLYFLFIGSWTTSDHNSEFFLYLFFFSFHMYIFFVCFSFLLLWIYLSCRLISLNVLENFERLYIFENI